MGIDKQSLKFLIQGKQRGVDFCRTAMIGRQFVWVDFALLRRIFKNHGMSIDRAGARKLIEEQSGYAEPLFRSLGATLIDSIDFSAYEGATICHDMNQPIREGMKKQYSAVYDGGSLEHVFNFPAAIRNCMELVEVGGHFLASTPANNQLGHGFYQFSPELFFRVFSAENGFALERLVVYEEQSTNTWYDVMDPGSLGTRVTLCNCNPTWILVQAKRISDTAVFRIAPQQSDYAATWHRHNSIDKDSLDRAALHPLHRGAPYYRVVALIPARMKRLIRASCSFFRPFNPKMFHRIR